MTAHKLLTTIFPFREATCIEPDDALRQDGEKIAKAVIWTNSVGLGLAPHLRNPANSRVKSEIFKAFGLKDSISNFEAINKDKFTECSRCD